MKIRKQAESRDKPYLIKSQGVLKSPGN